jgi:hypothetical protein
MCTDRCLQVRWEGAECGGDRRLPLAAAVELCATPDHKIDSDSVSNSLESCLTDEPVVAKLTVWAG